MNSIEPQIEAQPRYVYAQDDEIDLLELFAIVWAGKWLILGITILTAVVAYFVISAMPPVFNVSARINEISEYELQAIQPSQLSGGDAYQVKPLDVEQLYRKVLAQVDSLFVKKTFWEAHTGEPLGDIVNTIERNDIQKQFLEFESAISIALAGDDNQNPKLATISLESKNPTEAIDLLNSFLHYLDRDVVLKSLDQLRSGLKATLSRLTSDYAELQARELVSLDDKLIRLKEARDLAASLGIVETQYDQVENVESQILNNRQYLLGTRALSEEIKSLEARREKPLPAFVPQLRNMELWKKQLEGDLRQLDAGQDNIHAFVIVAPAEASLRPIKPNKMLLFIASVFSAGFLSLILVFVLHGVRTYKARQQPNAQD